MRFLKLFLSAAAQIKFTQNSVSNTPGQAMLGTVALGAVTVGNWLDNASIVQWDFYILDQSLASSALTAGLKQSGSTPTWTFTPDSDTGMVFVQLVTTSNDGTIASDTLCFGVPNITTGRMHPAFGAMARHVNFSGQTRGWADGDTDTTSKQVGAYLGTVDTLGGALVLSDSLTGGSTTGSKTFSIPNGTTTYDVTLLMKITTRGGGSEVLGDSYSICTKACWKLISGTASVIPLLTGEPLSHGDTSMATPSSMSFNVTGGNAVINYGNPAGLNAGTVVAVKISLEPTNL